MKRLSLLLILLTLLSFAGYSKVWTLSDSNLNVKFDDQLRVLTVTDIRCNKTWEQVPFKDDFSISKVTQKGNSLEITLTGPIKLGLNITLTAESDLAFTLKADVKAVFKELTIPSAFKTPDNTHYLLYTDGEGFLLQADDKEYPLGNGITYSCGGGLSMAWMGVVDNKLEAGYMAILETPFDAALRTKREDGLVTFSPVWMTSMEKFSYDRKVLYHFFDKGGYVAQCKKYREYIWEKNNVITLRDNQKKTPAIEKMIGAVHMYVWDNARDVSFAKDIKQAGIEKAFILWDANHTPYPEKDYDNRLKELGYASGVYDLYTDAHPRDSIPRPVDNEMKGAWLNRGNYPGLFKEITARKADGKFYSNSFGTYICPLAVRPEIIKRIEKELPIYPHESYFLDVGGWQ